MKLLGHAWVAVNSKVDGNRKLLILGSILPEIMYYTKNHPFDYEEIHEGGEKVHQYLLKSNKVKWADLGLGMVTHSYRKGADKFNLNENLSILGYKGDDVNRLRKRLSKVLKIDYETAKTRAHNILELAVELGIIKENPSFVKEFNKAIADRNTRKEIKKILADCFHKPHKAVSVSVDELLNKAKPSYFKDEMGLANLWSELSEIFDPIPDKKQLVELLLELSKNYRGKDKIFLKRCITWTKSNLESI